MQKDLTLVIDTNLLLQCRPIHQLPWRDIGGSRDIELILTRPVQREIDKLKGDGNGRRARRAREASSMIREVVRAKGQSLVVLDSSPKVTIKIALGLEPAARAGLDMSQPDDVIVALAEGIQKDNPGQDLAIFTHDTGVLSTAISMGLECISIPDDWLLEPEDDVAAKALRKAEAEVLRLRSQEPRIDIEFDSAGKRGKKLRFECSYYNPLSHKEKNELVDKALRANPERDLKQNKGDDFYGMILGSRVSDFDAAEYRKKYHSWKNDLAVWLDIAHESIAFRENRALLTFSAKNVGTRPAERVMIEIVSRGDVEVFVPSDVDAEPAIPAPPRPPKPKPQSLSLYPGGFLGVDLPYLRSHDFPEKRKAEAFYYRNPSTRQEIVLESELWRHGKGPEDFEILVAPSKRGRCTGLVEFLVHSANMSEPAVLRVPVEITANEVNCYDVAMRLISQIEMVD